MSEYLTWDNIALVVLAGLAIYFGLKFKWIAIADVRHWAESLIQSVEKYMATATGQEKLAAVVDKIYTFLPKLAKLFLTKEKIKIIVQEVFDEISELIEDDRGVIHTTVVPKKL